MNLNEPNNNVELLKNINTSSTNRSRTSSKINKYVGYWGADRPFANIAVSTLCKNIEMTVSWYFYPVLNQQAKNLKSSFYPFLKVRFTVRFFIIIYNQFDSDKEYKKFPKDFIIKTHRQQIAIFVPGKKHCYLISIKYEVWQIVTFYFSKNICQNS